MSHNWTCDRCGYSEEAGLENRSIRQSVFHRVDAVDREGISLDICRPCFDEIRDFASQKVLRIEGVEHV